MSDRAFTPKMAPPLASQTSGKAIASLVCGLLSFCLLLLTALPGFVLGLLALGDIRRSEGRLGGTALAVVGLVLSSLGILFTIAIGVAVLLPAVFAARNAARISVSSRNLKQIGLAMHNYHDVHNRFPLAGSENKKLGIGLSWRVRILPYLEQSPLYDRFDQNSPWDSPQNMALVEQMPEIYKAPGVNLPKGQTVYLGVAGGSPEEDREWYKRRTVFNASARGTGMADITDGTANTIMVVEADVSEAAIWTKPDDWEFDPNAPRRGLGSLRGTGFTALFAEGSVAFITPSVSDETLRRLFVMQDGQPLDGYVPPYYKVRGTPPTRRGR